MLKELSIVSSPSNTRRQPSSSRRREKEWRLIMHSEISKKQIGNAPSSVQEELVRWDHDELIREE